MIHALERSFEMKKSGYYHNKKYLISHVAFYQDLRKSKIRERSYFDVAYIDGYMMIHFMYLFFDEHEKDDDPFPSPFYILGAKEQPESPEEFDKLLKKAENIHKSSYVKAQKQIKKNVGDSGENDMVLHHPAYL